MRWGIKRRWGWVVLTWCCVVRWEPDSEHGGMYDLVCVDLVVMLLVVFDEGSMRQGVLTWWYLHITCFSFTAYDMLKGWAMR